MISAMISRDLFQGRRASEAGRRRQFVVGDDLLQGRDDQVVTFDGLREKGWWSLSRLSMSTLSLKKTNIEPLKP